MKNNNKEIVSSINENTEIIEELLNIANNFPNVKEEYTSANLNIRLEKNAQGNFFKRISILSSEIKMSIYLNNCKNSKIKSRLKKIYVV